MPVYGAYTKVCQHNFLVNNIKPWNCRTTELLLNMLVHNMICRLLHYRNSIFSYGDYRRMTTKWGPIRSRTARLTFCSSFSHGKTNSRTKVTRFVTVATIHRFGIVTYIRCSRTIPKPSYGSRLSSKRWFRTEQHSWRFRFVTAGRRKKRANAELISGVWVWFHLYHSSHTRNSHLSSIAFKHDKRSRRDRNDITSLEIRVAQNIATDGTLLYTPATNETGLVFCLVRDHVRTPCWNENPCTFLFRMREDEVAQLFWKIRKVAPTFDPNCFMSDDCSPFYNGFRLIFPESKTQKLLWAYHVIQAVKKVAPLSWRRCETSQYVVPIT